MSTTTTIKLSDRQVTMRKPKVRDIEAIQNLPTDFDKELILMSHLTELTPNELKEFDLDEYTKLQKQLEVFLGK